MLAYYIISFVYGAAIGSFVQVVATRLNVAPIMKTRSKCLSCGEALRVSDLLPVLSYVFLRGKCRYCKSPYGIQALLVEIAFGIVFALTYHFIIQGTFGFAAFAWFLYYTALFVSLGVIGLYDYRHSYVPTVYLSLFSVLSVGMLLIRYAYDPSHAVLLGPLVVALPFLLIWLATKGCALGLGDVILFAAVGAFFGIEQGMSVLLLSVWMGAIVGVITYVNRKRRNIMGTAIPFVPFIVAAFIIVLFTDMSVFSIASLFSW